MFIAVDAKQLHNCEVPPTLLNNMKIQTWTLYLLLLTGRCHTISLQTENDVDISHTWGSKVGKEVKSFFLLALRKSTVASATTGSANSLQPD